MPTLTELAKGLGVDATLVRRYVKRGMPIESVAAAAAWKAANIRPRVNEGQKQPKNKSAVPAKHKPRPIASQYQDARTKLADADAQMAQLTLLERRGELVSRERVRLDMARRLSSLRDSLLQIPARMQSVLAAETEDAKVHDLLMDELYLVLGQFVETA